MRQRFAEPQAPGRFVGDHKSAYATMAPGSPYIGRELAALGQRRHRSASGRHANDHSPLNRARGASPRVEKEPQPSAPAKNPPGLTGGKAGRDMTGLGCQNRPTRHLMPGDTDGTQLPAS